MVSMPSLPKRSKPFKAAAVTAIVVHLSLGLVFANTRQSIPLRYFSPCTGVCPEVTTYDHPVMTVSICHLEFDSSCCGCLPPMSRERVAPLEPAIPKLRRASLPNVGVGRMFVVPENPTLRN